MSKRKHFLSMLGMSLGLTIVMIFGNLGCSSIHSQAVRDLIDIETEKISQADTNAEEFVKATDQSIKSWKNSVEQLSGALQKQKTIESVHALVFSANQNISTKKGVDAHAAGYLIGELYLSDRMGLEQTVIDQFDEDYKALTNLAKQIRESWAALKKTQKEIDDFANRSFLATVDADLARELIVEFGADKETIDGVLKRSKQVNKIIMKASSQGLLQGIDSGRAHMVTEDVVNLLERIKN